MAAAWLLAKGVKAIGGTFAGGSTSPPAASSTRPPTGTEAAQVAQVAATYHLSPETLWGIFGTESSFGQNTGPSSAGALGPFQFLPSTWRLYGKGDPNDFTASLEAAARYLHALGADQDPTSAGTINALNTYNGNHGGANPHTSYASSVLALGRHFLLGGTP